MWVRVPPRVQSSRETLYHYMVKMTARKDGHFGGEANLIIFLVVSQLLTIS